MDKKSSIEWMEQFGIELVGYVELEEPDLVVHDPDGFDRENLEEDLEEEIEFCEFRQRIGRCTIEAQREYFEEGLRNGSRS